MAENARNAWWQSRRHRTDIPWSIAAYNADRIIARERTAVCLLGLVHLGARVSRESIGKGWRGYDDRPLDVMDHPHADRSLPRIRDIRLSRRQVRSSTNLSCIRPWRCILRSRIWSVFEVGSHADVA